MYLPLLLSGSIGSFLVGILPVQGVLDLPIWALVLVVLGLTHITIATVTIFLHRHQAHRALDLHPVISHFFRFWSWLTTGMVTRQWVAVHRKHHARCETVEDPHSPQIFGIRKVLWRGAELYTQQAETPQTVEKFGRGTPDDWIERHLYSRHTHLGLALMLAIDVILFGALGITAWAVQMLWIPFWAAGVVNGLGHYAGYRNFETPDASTNLVPWGILIGGEELHNNHHAYPNSARLSNRWWELDIGWFYIRCLEWFGLARVKRLAPRCEIRLDKLSVDAETLYAVLRNRVHIMTLYTRTVAMPVLRQELRAADATTQSLIKRARPLLTREYSRKDERAAHALQTVLASSGALATVHRYREQLVELWNQAALSQEKRLEALREWCAAAEQSGVERLREFALLLRGYTWQPRPLGAC